MAGADVLHRVATVEVLRSREHSDTFVAVRRSARAVRRVEVVQHRVAGHNLDPSDGVDQLDQAQKPDPDALVDVDPEILLDGGDARARAPVGLAAGVMPWRGAPVLSRKARAWILTFGPVSLCKCAVNGPQGTAAIAASRVQSP